MEKIIKALQSLVLSVKAHPDYDPNVGEFYDLVNIAEKALNNQPSPLISNGATQEEYLRKVFNAGIECNKEHPDDDSYDDVHFKRVIGHTPINPASINEVMKKHFGSIWSHQDFSAYEPYYVAAMQEYASLQSSQALAKQRNEIIEEVTKLLDQYWTFDNNQQHTHSWHSKQDFLEKLKSPE